MKHILLIAAFAIAFLQSYSQEIKVEGFKKTEIYEVEGGSKLSVAQFTKGDVTGYFVSYLDQRNPENLNVETIRLSIEEMKKVVDALVLLTDDKYKVGESTVAVTNDISVRKVKMSGTKYWITNQRGFTYINAKQVRKLKEAVYEFFEFP